MIPKKLILPCLAVWLNWAVPVVWGGTPGPASQSQDAAGETTWTTDYAAALARATAEKKTVLLNFTGSDWCIWCHRLRDEVFVQKPFGDYAREHLVLVEVDFPRRKALPEKLQARNDALSEQFKVEGYPTIILVDGSGNELGRTGYMQGGAKTFVRELKRFASKAGKTQ